MKIKFAIFILLSSSYLVSADKEEKIKNDDQKQQVSITIGLPPAVTNLPREIAQAGQQVSSSINSSVQLLSSEAQKAVRGISQAGQTLTDAVNNSVIAVRGSVENGVNNVENAVNRFSNIIIIKFCSLAAILLGMNMIHNDNNLKGAFMFSLGLLALFKSDAIMGKFKMHEHKKQ